MHNKQPSRCYVQLLRVFSTITNINHPDGATYSRTVYVQKYSPRARARVWFLRLLEVNGLRSEHLFYHKNH